jgi:large subunit ribosomal protein L7/L12
VAVGVAAPVEQAMAAAEQTEFKVLLTEVGNNKIQVIKVVRAITGLGLKEAKALVDSVPGTIKEGIPAEEAQGIKVQFEEVGAKVEIK